MRNIRYTGSAHVREFSEEDLSRAFGVSHSGGLRFDTRDYALMQNGVEVSNALADKLIESGEWEFVSGDVPEVKAATPPSEGDSAATEGETRSLGSAAPIPPTTGTARSTGSAGTKAKGTGRP